MPDARLQRTRDLYCKCEHPVVYKSFTREVCMSCGAQRDLKMSVCGDVLERGQWESREAHA